MIVRVSFEGSETRKMILRARCRDMLRNATKVAALIVAATNFAHAETADVKYRGRVDLKPFTCTDITRSSFIEGVCYDKVQSYMLINLSGTFYHYCELPAPTFDAFMIAPSMGKFYNQNIRGSGSDGPYDCRTHNVPSYR